MTAEHDRDTHDRDTHDGDTHDGAALLAAITGETPPDEALADDAFLAEYRTATADVALLREQLGLIGQALAEPPAAPAPAPGTGGVAAVTPLSTRRTRPGPLAVALKGLVAAAAAGLVLGMGWLVVHSDGMSADDQGGSSAADSSAGQPQAEAGGKLSHAGYLACARLVVEGTVAEVESVPGTGLDRVTLDVDRYYKPAKGQDRIHFPLGGDVEPKLRAGDHVLIGIPQGQAEPDVWTTGEKEIARERAWITEALPASRTLPCR
ncbi:hypothetical protein AB0I06_13190 [Streptomyces sp. NPDC050674]|uniref:hypothetical protein n=1 Tax=Streptomyces sp. NPDC050674 TaxID=3157216 RepID=UPI0034376D07